MSERFLPNYTVRIFCILAIGVYKAESFPALSEQTVWWPVRAMRGKTRSGLVGLGRPGFGVSAKRNSYFASEGVR
jgi:hypothetical protein